MHSDSFLFKIKFSTHSSDFIHALYFLPMTGQLQGSGYSEQEPEFLSPLENLTVAQGRDVQFTCTVHHIGTFKVWKIFH